jgi:hypothetical protein
LYDTFPFILVTNSTNHCTSLTYRLLLDARLTATLSRHKPVLSTFVSSTTKRAASTADGFRRSCNAGAIASVVSGWQFRLSSSAWNFLPQLAAEWIQRWISAAWCVSSSE